MILFSAAIKIGSDTFLYKVYENGFKAIVRVADKAIGNLPVLYVPSSIESDFLKRFGDDLVGALSPGNSGNGDTSIKKVWSWLLNSIKPAQA